MTLSPDLPKLALVATGGTIAGQGDLHNYKAGTVSAESLLNAIPQLAELATWHVEQLFSLDSSDLTPAHWLELSARINALASDDAIGGVVVTHGTDTLEETAYALSLLVSTDKPIVLTAAMRPATSLSADGPLNLVQAARVAINARSSGRGVLVVAHDEILAAASVAKRHTHGVHALQARGGGALGVVIGHEVIFHASRTCSCLTFNLAPGAKLPRVDVVAFAAGQDPDLIDWLISKNTKGLVLALPGHGTVPSAFLPALNEARARGVVIVRSTRVPNGIVARNHNAEDDTNGWIAAGYRTPVQARVLLMLAIAQGLSMQALAELFYASVF